MNFVFSTSLYSFPGEKVDSFESTMSDCGREDRSCFDEELSLKLRIAAIVTIFVGSGIGILIPLSGRFIRFLSPERDLFTAIKAFAGGVILSTGFVHVLPDAFESLSSPCLGSTAWAKFPFAGFVAMMGALLALLADFFAMSYYDRLQRARLIASSSPEQPTLRHEHGILSADTVQGTLRQRVVAQVLEMGIVAHSIIIGITLGASQVPCTIKPLFGALSFHQFFEGMGLGGCIALADFKPMSMVIMALAFAMTTPLGIAIGIGISSTYNEKNDKAFIIQGLFDAASSGILIYMGLVDLIATDFLTGRMRTNGRLQVMSFVALFFGIGAMSLIAYWA